MPVTLHRCRYVWWKAGPCWRVERALRDMGIAYTVAPGPSRPSDREQMLAHTGQQLYPAIEFENGIWYREESKDMETRIRAGKLLRLTVALLAAAVLVPAAAAKGKVFVTLTKPVPAHAAHGDRIVVAFTAKDESGRTVISGPFYVKVICPTKDAFTRALAYVRRDGTYRVTAIVPPGGFGSLEIGFGRQRFTVTNPPK